jgi:DNA polymerase
LEIEAEKIKNCKKCKKGKIGKAVPGEGNPDAKIVFVGEAPGREEAKVGRPFVGRSGKFLTQLLLQIGIKREDVFITSPVKYLPAGRQSLPKRGTPTNKDITHGMTHLFKQIEIINPKLIVLLGQVAVKALLEKGNISEMHGEMVKKGNRLYFATFHPAAAIRFPKIKALIIDDFKKLKELVRAKKISK